MRGTHGAQIVSGLQATQPRQHVGIVQRLTRCASHIDVERLRLIDPLLSTRCTFNQPLGFDLEGGGINLAQFGWDTINPSKGAIKELEIGDHDLVP